VVIIIITVVVVVAVVVVVVKNVRICQYRAFDGGRKSTNCSNSIDRHRYDEANHLNDRHPPRETCPTYTNRPRLLQPLYIADVHPNAANDRATSC